MLTFPLMNEREKEPDLAYIYVISNPSYNDICLSAWDSILYPGTPVVYQTKFGLDLGIVLGPAPKKGAGYCPGCTEVCGAGADRENEFPEPVKMEVGEIDYIDHLATPKEMAKYEKEKAREEAALRVCREKVLENKLDMKLVTAHFLLAEPKIIFFFTADSRVDFRNLVKDLGAIFHLRIELRQIGVRDESRLIGGLSVCGRDYCCPLFQSQMEPVTIRMAKEQNLSLSSMKISGPCGRLLCCLNYEYEYYLEEKASYPPEGTRLKLGHELWKVNEVNILSHKLSVLGSEGRSMYIPLSEVRYDVESGYWQVSQEFQDEILS